MWSTSLADVTGNFLAASVGGDSGDGWPGREGEDGEMDTNQAFFFWCYFTRVTKSKAS